MQGTTSVNFLQALEQITEHWSPRVIGRVNNQYVKAAKVQGQLAWHKHDSEDEMFLVVYGRLILSSKTRKSLSIQAISMWCRKAHCTILSQRRSAGSCLLKQSLHGIRATWILL
jgi:hypothetical protein